MTWFVFTARGVEPGKVPEVLEALARAGFRNAAWRTTRSDGDFGPGEFVVEFGATDLATFAERLSVLMAIFRGHALALRSKGAVFLESRAGQEEG